MNTTIPSSVIITTQPVVGDRGHTSCGVVAAEKILVLIISRGLDSEESSEKALQDIQTQAEALGADAIVDVKIKYKPINGLEGSMMVSVSGNAVKLDPPR